MASKLKIVLATVAGAAVGSLVTYGLNAQGKKVYTISELQVLDAKLAAEIAPKIAAAQSKAGGRNFNTGGGKITPMEGAVPDRVAITEWESLSKAQDYFKSMSQTTPERDKALKTIRRYAVEER